MPSPLNEALDRLLAGADLTEALAGEVLLALTDPDCPPALAGAVLTALRMKGETAGEIRGFARAMRGLARRPDVDVSEGLADIVGT
ncbi:MAG: anthranilate phosphoribosyltransferase, partial [Gammaproteobacteria bacterium]